MDDGRKSPAEISSDEGEPDARVQIELERLNHAAESINHLELQLDESRKLFTEFQSQTEIELVQLEKKIGSSVTKAQVYYDARMNLYNAKQKLSKAKDRFERAQALHIAAKELALASMDYIDEAEQSNSKDSSWSETYRHAMVQAGEADREKYRADAEQQAAQQVYDQCENLVRKLEKDLRGSINKSKQFYETKADYLKESEFQKRKIDALASCVAEAKREYQQSLRNLELISNEIHEKRNKMKGIESQLDADAQRTSPLDQPSLKPNERKVPSDPTLRSLLLRTESLPTGVFISQKDHSIPENCEADDDSASDQFILAQKSPENPRILVHEHPVRRKKTMNIDLEQTTSSSSHLTDDDDDYDDGKKESLQVLTDEQINHLRQKSSSDNELHRILPDDLLYSLSNPLSKLVLDKSV